MKDQKLQDCYHEIWKKEFTTANLRNAGGIRNTKGFKDSNNVDIIRQKCNDNYVILYGKPTSKKHIEKWKNKKTKK
jgi:hypothetical protein